VDQQRSKHQARVADYEHDAEPVKAALTAAGIDTGDFGRFVNRPVPGVLEPPNFDAARAMPVLLEWLPRITNEKLREAVVRHLAIKTRDGLVAEALIEEYRRPGSASHKWVVGDTLAFVCQKRHFSAITDLAADTSYGMGRQPLVGMLWRIKTPAADEILLNALADPDTALAAMSALRRRFGNAAARKHIASLLQQPDQRVRRAASQQLRRIDRQLTDSS
jgi:HEAT repeat protein